MVSLNEFRSCAYFVPIDGQCEAERDGGLKATSVTVQGGWRMILRLRIILDDGLRIRVIVVK
jgi:hypothetical protein